MKPLASLCLSAALASLAPAQEPGRPPAGGLEELTDLEYLRRALAQLVPEVRQDDSPAGDDVGPVAHPFPGGATRESRPGGSVPPHRPPARELTREALRGSTLGRAYRTPPPVRDDQGRITEMRDQMGNLHVIQYDERGNLKGVELIPGAGPYTDPPGRVGTNLLPSPNIRDAGLPWYHHAYGKLPTEQRPESSTRLDPEALAVTPSQALIPVAPFLEDPMLQQIRSFDSLLTKPFAVERGMPDRQGRFDVKVHDMWGRPSYTMDQNGKLTFYSYDVHGNLASVTDHKGNRTIIGRDQDGRRNIEVDGEGRIEIIGYDSQGRAIRARRDAEGKLTVEVPEDHPRDRNEKK
jgi:YD repeat-containing protein